MPELTRDHFDKVVAGLASKDDFKAIKTVMAHLATQDSVNQVSARLTTIEGILNQHTTTLDAIVKDTSNWNVEMVVMRDRMSRYEDALRAVSEKLNLDLTPFLH